MTNLKKTIFRICLISYMLLMANHNNKFFVSIIGGLTAYANQLNIVSVTELDVTDGQIEGQFADFKINILHSWMEFLVIYREELPEDSPVIEKISFNYKPIDKVLKPIFLMNLYVFNNEVEDLYFNEMDLKVLLETEKNIFAVKISEDNNIEDEVDNVLYELLLKEIEKSLFYKNFIELKYITELVVRNTLTINECESPFRNVLNIDGVGFVPLRETCEKLKAKVMWIEEEKFVKVIYKKNEFIFNPEDNHKKFNSIIYKDIVYVDSAFFDNILGCSTEVDDEFNIKINN